MVQCDKSHATIADRSIGEIVRTVLLVAKSAHRITLGFSDAIKLLSKTPDEAEFCFLAEPARGDSATHMHEVLLQAFCYEHGIRIIKVDSGRKLAQVLGTLNACETCVLIRKSMIHATKQAAKDEFRNDDYDNGATEPATTEAAAQFDTDAATVASAVAVSKSKFHSREEGILVNFCENSWHNIDYCTVKLPEY